MNRFFYRHEFFNSCRIAFCCLAMFVKPVISAERFWNSVGSGSTHFDYPSNWIGGVPGPYDTARFYQSNNRTALIGSDTTVSGVLLNGYISSAEIRSFRPVVGLNVLSDATLSVRSGVSYGIYRYGPYEMNGNLRLFGEGTVRIAGDITVGQNSNFEMDGGIHVYARHLRGSSAYGGHRSWTVSGAGTRLTTVGNVLLGDYGGDSFLVSDEAYVETSRVTMRDYGTSIVIRDSSWHNRGNFGVGTESSWIHTSSPAGLAVYSSQFMTTSLGIGSGAVDEIAPAGQAVFQDSQATVIGTTELSSTGYLAIDGGHFSTGTFINAGILDHLAGTLTIDGGEYLSGSASDYHLQGDGRNATVTLENGANWNPARNLSVASGNDGTLNVKSGSAATIPGYFVVGRSGDEATGSVDVSGADSSISADNEATIGLSGAGVLNVSDGGSADFRKDLFIGRYSTSQGHVTVGGVGSPSLITVGTAPSGDSAEYMDVGSSGKGTLDISQGGTVNVPNGGVRIGIQSAAVGSVNVTGGSLNVADDVFIGMGAQGTLTVKDRGSVSIDGPLVAVGYDGAGNGTLVVRGSGSEFDGAASEEMVIGNNGSTGLLSIEDGGSVDAGEELQIGTNGRVQMSGPETSTLTVTRLRDSLGNFEQLGGTLNAEVFDGDLNQNGGVLKVGSVRTSERGTTRINGDYNQNGGALSLELESTLSADSLEVSGTATLNGTLKIDLLASESSTYPVEGDSFTIISAGELLEIPFSSTDLPQLRGGLSFEVDYDLIADEVTLNVVGKLGDLDGDGDVNAVDIDLLAEAALDGSNAPLYDLNGDGVATFEMNATEASDSDILIHTILGTEYGDANLDGQVNALDTSLLIANLGVESTWNNADFNGDGFSNALDTSILIQNLGFNAQNPMAAASVPEPAAPLAVALGSLTLIALARRPKRFGDSTPNA